MQKQATLYYRNGSSDKIYQVALEPKENLFLVTFAFGRRGSTLNTGSKTAQPVDEKTALSIYEKLIQEKKAKGYTEGSEGTPYQHSAQEGQVTGILPQLLNPIEEVDLPAYLQAPDWCMQEKFDGKRLLLKKEGQQVTGINRRGLVTGLPETIQTEAAQIDGSWIIDGECVGEFYYAFDLLAAGPAPVAQVPYEERLWQLKNLLQPFLFESIKLTVTSHGYESKRTFLDILKQENREGVVFKDLAAPYTPGRPARGGSQLKYKFYSTASFIVAGGNQAKRSVRLALYEQGGQKPAGNVTIPANHEVPDVGAVVEVRYLYAFLESGTIYQPVYLGPREDVPLRDCTTSQLKYRRSPEEEDQQP